MSRTSWKTRDKLRRVANLYGAAVEDGLPPTKTVAARLGISHSAAANLVAKAREHKMLPPTKRGRATRGAERGA